MKSIVTSISSLASVALLALAASCASDLHNKENLAVAAGFKIITPTTAEHRTLLPTLPAGKVTPITHQGKSYYVLPDVKNNRAYVGGQQEYQKYQQLRLAQQISNDNLMAAQMNQFSAMNWGAWGGWGMAGPMGYRRY